MQVPSLSFSEQVAFAAGYRSLVRDLQRIRFHNLTFLLQEAEAICGKPRGAQAYLAAVTGVKAPLLSMLLAQAVHSDTGKRRQIGDDTATKLETGMGKPRGWLDVDRSEARDYREAALLDKLRQITPAQRQAVEQMLDAFLPEKSAATPANQGPQSPATQPLAS